MKKTISRFRGRQYRVSKWEERIKNFSRLRIRKYKKVSCNYSVRNNTNFKRMLNCITTITI